MIETKYALLETAVLALAAEIEQMHARYTSLRQYDPYVAQSYQVAADELRRLVTAVQRQPLPTTHSQVTALAQKAHQTAMIAAGETEDYE